MLTDGRRAAAAVMKIEEAATKPLSATAQQEDW
jgi:hypothetical protein